MKPEQACPYNLTDRTGHMEMVSNPSKAPKFIRCPVCGRRLKPRLYDCHFNIPGATPCWHYSVPPHKKKEWWKKKKSLTRGINNNE